MTDLQGSVFVQQGLGQRGKMVTSGAKVLVFPATKRLAVEEYEPSDVIELGPLDEPVRRAAIFGALAIGTLAVDYWMFLGLAWVSRSVVEFFRWLF